MKFLIIFIFLLSTSFADELPDIKNIVINKELKKYDKDKIIHNEEDEIN